MMLQSSADRDQIASGEAECGLVYQSDQGRQCLKLLTFILVHEAETIFRRRLLLKIF